MRYSKAKSDDGNHAEFSQQIWPFLTFTIFEILKISTSKFSHCLTKNSKIDPYLKNFLTYHPTLNSAIDRSRRALQLCRGDHSEWVGSHLHFSSILDFQFSTIENCGNSMVPTTSPRGEVVGTMLFPQFSIVENWKSKIDEKCK